MAGVFLETYLARQEPRPSMIKSFHLQKHALNAQTQREREIGIELTFVVLLVLMHRK
jgi:hypothetical protein